jgi:hypothetical protein
MSSPQPANPDATHALTRRWWTEDAEGLNRGEALLADLRANAGSRPPCPERDLRGIRWLDADLSSLDLSGCALRGADLPRADLHGARLIGADLRAASSRKPAWTTPALTAPTCGGLA